MPKSPRLSLPAALDTSGAALVAAQLTERRGKALTLDASGVERVGALGLQVLLSARLTWADDGHRLNLADPSPALTSALELAGVDLGIQGSA